MGDKSNGRDTLTTAQITIFNHTYRVTSDDNGERASRVARLVDTRMRETASQITTHDVARIAVLTALQLADELLTLKELGEREREVAAAPDESPGDNAPGTNDEESPATSRATWFESIFDSEPAPSDTRESRMGNRLSERLRTARQAETEPDTVGENPKLGNE